VTATHKKCKNILKNQIYFATQQNKIDPTKSAKKYLILMHTILA